MSEVLAQRPQSGERRLPHRDLHSYVPLGSMEHGADLQVVVERTKRAINGA